MPHRTNIHLDTVAKIPKVRNREKQMLQVKKKVGIHQSKFCRQERMHSIEERLQVAALHFLYSEKGETRSLLKCDIPESVKVKCRE